MLSYILWSCINEIVWGNTIDIDADAYENQSNIMRFIRAALTRKFLCKYNLLACVWANVK